jgi:hypothetical protein
VFAVFNIGNGVRGINRSAFRVFAQYPFVDGLDDEADGDQCGDDAEDLADIHGDIGPEPLLFVLLRGLQIDGVAGGVEDGNAARR